MKPHHHIAPTVPGPINRLTGVLLGTAVGDAVGLPAEGLGPDTLRRRWPGPWRHRLIFGHGLVSDDTEHTLMVADCLIEHPTDSIAFQRALARRLRWWLAALPGGVGLATGRAILKLWIGIAPGHNGIFSAGNGPLMRSAIIGARFARDPARRHTFITASTRLTHIDPRAELAALTIAETVAAICVEDERLSQGPAAVLSHLTLDPEGHRLLEALSAAAQANASVREFAKTLGLEAGVTGYAWHTAPVALYAWWRHRGDFRSAVEAVLNCGGDTDSVGAIVGALSGADLGDRAIPHDWIAGLCDWPRTTTSMRRLGTALDRAMIADRPAPAPAWFWPGIIPRNLFFFGVVLTHGVARLVIR